MRLIYLAIFLVGACVGGAVLALVWAVVNGEFDGSGFDVDDDPSLDFSRFAVGEPVSKPVIRTCAICGGPCVPVATALWHCKTRGCGFRYPHDLLPWSKVDA